MQKLCILAVLLAIAASATSSPIVLVDNSQGSYLHVSENDVSLDGNALSSLISALSGLMPPSKVDANTNALIGQVVKSSPLKKARAHVVLNVAGLSQDSLAEIFANKPSCKIHLQAQEPAATVVDSLASVLESNPEVSTTILDEQGLQGCSGDCIEEHMHATAGCMHAKHEGSSLTFASGASLNLDQLADKLFAIEAASLYSGLQAQIQQAAEADQDVHVLESTLVGLQGLEAAHGSDSEVVAAAHEGIKDLLKWAVEKLDAKYGGDVTYQVAGAPARKGTVQEIMGWKQNARRRLSGEERKVAASEKPAAVIAKAPAGSRAYPPANETAALKLFTAKACGYGGFILILYFTLAGVWCMCNMPMKQDTMLFGAKKND